MAGAVAGGAALGAIGGVGGGSYRALKVARKAYNKMPGTPRRKGLLLMMHGEGNEEGSSRWKIRKAN